MNLEQSKHFNLEAHLFTVSCDVRVRSHCNITSRKLKRHHYPLTHFSET